MWQFIWSAMGAAQAHGHRFVLLPTQVVRQYVPRNKTDRADAKGLFEAARNESLRPCR